MKIPASHFKSTHMLRLCQLILLAFPAVQSIHAQTSYCAFKVTVKSSSQVPVQDVGVWLLQADGAPFARTQTDKQGVAMLCDAPAELVDIQVGGNLCGAMIVKYLRPLWRETRQVLMFYDGCHEDFLVSSGCYITLRLRDDKSQPIPDAQFIDAVHPNDPRKELSDAYGRLFRFVPWGGSLVGAVDKAGYSVAEVVQLCKPGEGPQLDLVVLLHKR